MSRFIDRTRPRTSLTDGDQDKVLDTTGKYRSGFRDHVLFSVMFGTGLRVHEAVALNVGDVTDGEVLHRRIKLRVFKRSAKTTKIKQEVILPDKALRKLRFYFVWKEQEEESLTLDAPLFCAKGGSKRLSIRAVQERFAYWQMVAGVERRYCLHEVRHTFGTHAYQAENDPAAAQVLLRHGSVETTMIYAHVSDEQILQLARKLPC